MKVYFDTSAPIKLYYPEAESETLAAWIGENNIAIPVSSFHELELRNAFALKLFRDEITQDQFEISLDIIHVASAIEGKFECFLSYDYRQNTLAENSGLEMASKDEAPTLQSPS